MLEDIKNVKAYDEVKNMNYDEGREYIAEILKFHKVSDLKKYWDRSDATIYGFLFKRFGMDKKSVNLRNIAENGGTNTNTATPEKKKRPYTRSVDKQKKQFEEVTNDNEKLAIQAMESKMTPMVQKLVTKILSETEKPVINGISINFNGTFNGSYIANQILKYSDILDENTEYKITFAIEEKPCQNPNQYSLNLSYVNNAEQTTEK